MQTIFWSPMTNQVGEDKMKRNVKIAMVMTAISAICGFLFLFVSVFMLGIDRPDMHGHRGKIGSFIFLFSTPFGYFIDWMVRQDIIKSDNVFIGSILWLIYWALLGAIFGFGIYCFMHLILNRFNYFNKSNGNIKSPSNINQSSPPHSD